MQCQQELLVATVALLIVRETLQTIPTPFVCPDFVLSSNMRNLHAGVVADHVATSFKKSLKGGLVVNSLLMPASAGVVACGCAALLSFRKCSSLGLGPAVSPIEVVRWRRSGH